MGGYLALMFVSTICFFISMRFNNYELFSPGPIILLGFITSIALSIVGLFFWNHYALTSETVTIVLTGLCGVTFANGLYWLFLKKTKRSQSHMRPNVLEMHTATWKYFVLLSIVLFAIALRIYEAYELARQLGLNVNSFTDLSRELRNATSTLFSTTSIKQGIGYSIVERQLEKVANMSGYAAVFVLALAFRKGHISNRRDCIWSILILLACASFQIVAGTRGMIFYWIIAFFIYLSFFLYRGRDVEGRKAVTFSLLKAIVISGVVCALFMYFSASLVGRTAKTSVTDYVSFYFGGSIPSLQILNDLNRSGATIAHGPVLVFYSVYLALLKYHFISELPAYSISWVDCGGHASNIFTCFGRYYYGGGLVGVFFYSVLATIILIGIYHYSRERMTPSSLVATGFISAYAFDCAREEFIFSRLMGTTNALNLVILAAVTVFLLTNMDFGSIRYTHQARTKITGAHFNHNVGLAKNKSL